MSLFFHITSAISFSEADMKTYIGEWDITYHDKDKNIAQYSFEIHIQKSSNKLISSLWNNAVKSKGSDPYQNSLNSFLGNMEIIVNPENKVSILKYDTNTEIEKFTISQDGSSAKGKNMNIALIAKDIFEIEILDTHEKFLAKRTNFNNVQAEPENHKDKDTKSSVSNKQQITYSSIISKIKEFSNKYYSFIILFGVVLFIQVLFVIIYRVIVSVCRKTEQPQKSEETKSEKDEQSKETNSKKAKTE